MNFLRKTPVSPFILTLYSILSLWVVNYDQTPFFSIFRVLFLCLGIALVSLILFRLILRDWSKAGLICSLTLVFFYMYGHIYNLIKSTEIAGVEFGRHRYLLVVMAILFIVCAFLILKFNHKLKNSTLYVNIFTAFLLFYVCIQAGIRLTRFGGSFSQPSSTHEVSIPDQIPGKKKRDVYYIVMDAYSRQDLLLKNFGFDNSGFLNDLKELGFVLPNCTLSNYEGTQYSISSSLNMNYFEQLEITFSDLPIEPEDEDNLGIVHSNLVIQKFRDLGYKIVTFKTLYPFINLSDSDIYYDVDQFQPFYSKIESINFQDLFFRTTLMVVPIGAQEADPEKFRFIPDILMRIFNPRATQFFLREYKLYDQYVFELEKLKELPKIPETKFVYAHILITHQPFVFNLDGSLRDSFLDTPDAYVDQIRFSNEQLLEIIKSILANSDPEPVIIIQGDHSIVYQGVDRLKILNAYYLPDGGSELVYPSITPVNTFRIILNRYFGETLPLLPDHSYYRETLGSKETNLIEAGESCVE